MTLTLIAAMARNRVIGADNSMPWHLPAEMAHFRRTTSGKTVVMGRKTFQSLGGPLPKRRNVILTRDRGFAAEGCEVVHDVEEAIAKFGDGEELMIIGGAEIYAQFLPRADKLLLTEVEADVEGDAYFPSFDPAEWRVDSTEKHEIDDKNAFAFRIMTYMRN
ncbi:type 3 dihydrofolate reductase [Paenibacillus sp. R14(2021)]|uniref:type 3 dihydrofolate reductase n=1 Tax=Paenibacillus sp. R14(2021) TaxID=2859228 RepID=UPI001C615681|nr:type 3 dihydrofolate reductase [Paenibacillus sp. R14(2021)]